MAPVEARIFFVDDNDRYQLLDGENLEMGGHKVVETAKTFEEALAKIPELDKKGVNVAIVDGSLSRFSHGTLDGERIAEEIRKQHPDIKIVGHSSDRDINNADINCQKHESPKKLVEIVTNI